MCYFSSKVLGFLPHNEGFLASWGIYFSINYLSFSDWYTLWYMKTILVDAVDAFVIEGEGIYKPMYDLLEAYPNVKIILTGANDSQIEQFGLTNMPYELFTLNILNIIQKQQGAHSL